MGQEKNNGRCDSTPVCGAWQAWRHSSRTAAEAAWAASSTSPSARRTLQQWLGGRAIAEIAPSEFPSIIAVRRRLLHKRIAASVAESAGACRWCSRSGRRAPCSLACSSISRLQRAMRAEEPQPCFLWPLLALGLLTMLQSGRAPRPAGTGESLNPPVCGGGKFSTFTARHAAAAWCWGQIVSNRRTENFRLASDPRLRPRCRARYR
ncbi:hypothetical protein FB567DRAFT_180493 [Paraphoma chrysanthemicola]|uniref:Uncharacterized protein n=1 Tax=Paraphoma chrysanthemicola TaxID=798071 RepID=A0A8K0RDU7_9PLEO|nr:hypothetical protein FB567DRAFT_180493 [Paraphoma chrysanthemicola]